MNELYHYGVKGMKWGKHRSGGYENQMVGSGGAVVELEELEEEIRKNEEAYTAQEGINRAIAGKETSSKFNKAFHEVIGRRNSDRYRRNVEVGKRKVQQAKAIYAEWTKSHGFTEHSDLNGQDELISVMDMTPDDLMHHGIKGQKWGIRRFQPYQSGAKVAGGKEVGLATKVQQRLKGSIVEHRKRSQERKDAKAEAKAAKKQAKADKKAADYEETKQKAIKSGTIEDLAKFKGDLTPQQYSEAFLRLQNEKRMEDLIAANKKSGWETVEKGIAIVERFGKYANTIATAKENFNKFDEAINKKDKEARKERKEAAKNAALTSVTTLDELNKAQRDLDLNADEYSKGLKILQTKANGRKLFDDGTFGPSAKPKEAEQKPKAENKPMDGTYTPVSENKGNSAPAKAAPETKEKGKRIIRGLSSYMDQPVRYNSTTTLRFGDSTIRRLSATASSPSQTRKDMKEKSTLSKEEQEYRRRLENVRRTYAG